MKLGTTYRDKPRRCPKCDVVIDGTTGVGCDATAKPGDLSICCYCASVLEFTSDGFNLVPENEIAAMDADVRELIDDTRQAVRALNARRRGTPSTN